MNFSSLCSIFSDINVYNKFKSSFVVIQTDIPKYDNKILFKGDVQ